MHINPADVKLPHGALHGVRILDLSQIAAGPYCTSMLGDFGATVIKVEPPQGDALRAFDAIFSAGESAYFFGVNRSKRDIALDIKTPAGREVLHKLLAEADVVVLSMRPSAVARLGLCYEDLAPRYPRLVYCLITAFGETGPRAEQPGMDIIAQALGGIMGLTGEVGGSPLKAGVPVGDFLGSFLACLGITLALRVRDRDGVGQKVSINLLDGQVSLLANYVAAYGRTHALVRPVGGGHPQIVPYQVFEAADGPFVVACLTERFWLLLCDAIGRADLKEHAQFKTNPLRVRNREILVPLLAEIFRTRDREYWIAQLGTLDVPVSPINRLEEVMVDPQVLHNGMMLELAHPRHGAVHTVSNPVHLATTPAAPHGYPPGLGQHTDAILKELGYAAEAIAALRGAGTVR